MSARSKARKRALDILFESEQRGVDARGTLALRVAAAEPPMNPYVSELVTGVVEERAALDARITAASPSWTLDRMPAVDRTVLRIATWELVRGEVPPAVVIDEAVELVKTLSTDDSPAFVNGVLGAVLAASGEGSALG